MINYILMKLKESENNVTPSNIINNSIQMQIIDKYIAAVNDNVAEST